MTRRVARVYICWAWVGVKFFWSWVRISCPSLFRVWVAPYSLTVGVVWGVGWGFCLGGVRPCCVMRPRYCLVIFWARFLSLFQTEFTA
jgi:hypothetical protein